MNVIAVTAPTLCRTVANCARAACTFSPPRVRRRMDVASAPVGAMIACHPPFRPMRAASGVISPSWSMACAVARRQARAVASTVLASLVPAPSTKVGAVAVTAQA